MARGARVVGSFDDLEVEGHGPIFVGEMGSDFIAALDVIGHASLAELRRGVLRSVESERTLIQIYLVDESPERVARDPSRFNPLPVEIWVNRGFEDPGNPLTVFAATYGDPEDGLPDSDEVAAILNPYLARYGARAEVGVDDDEADYGGYYQLGVEFSLPLRGKTVRDAYEMAQGALELLDATDGGSLRYETTLELLRAGRVDVLIGQVESEWIDFKREAYKKDDHDRLELAKDVAAFANSDGGLIVLGVATTRTGHVETASKIIPCPSGALSVQWIRATIGRRVYPEPERIEVFSIPTGSGEAWAIAIPPQPEASKPFLVHGAVIDGKVNDAYVSLVSRRDDETVALTPQAIHALIATGRMALRD